jgi:DNA-binding CsgD family transcriptional regulator
MHCLLAYGSVLSGAGRWQEAEEVLLEALGPNGSRSSGHRGEASARLASLRVDQGRLDEAAQLLAPYEDRVCACEPLARLHLARNEPELAVAVARRGLKLLRGDALRSAPLYTVLVDAELRIGAIDDAEQAAADLARTASAAEVPLIHAEAALAHGQVKMVKGDTDAAITCLETALDHLRGDERPTRRGEAHLALGGGLAVRGDAAGAIAETRAALAIFERLGANARSDQAAAQLRALGAPSRPRAQDAAALVGSLSPRESEVLDLLSQGLTNAEIAGRLFISPKTAEHHVGRVLVKLGARSRAEAAAIAATSRMRRQ